MVVYLDRSPGRRVHCGCFLARGSTAQPTWARGDRFAPPCGSRWDCAAFCQEATIPTARGFPVRHARLLATAVVIITAALASAPQAQAQGTFAPGTVVQLQGTPHLWFTDHQGILHWGGDTRALAGRHIDWRSRATVSLERLRTLPRGDPWLSTGLLKDGDPIYLVKWETDWAEPQLFHIRSIGDVELFGINGSNYGQFVIERGQWEHQFGISAAGLQRHVLPSTTVPGTTRDNPVPIGTAVDMPNGWRIAVLSVTPNANRIIAEINRFTDPPKENHQFVIAKLLVVRIGESSDEPPEGLRAVGGSGVSYISQTLSYCDGSRGGSGWYIPDALANTEVFPGGSVTGNVCWEVRSSDVGSLVMYYDPAYDRSERRYFSLML